MKILLIIISVLTLTFTSTFTSILAQDMIMAVQTEYTVTGCQGGASVMYESKKQWGLGLFYQTAFASSEVTSGKEIFYGTQIQAPLLRTERLSFYTTLRVGLVNEQFIVIAPGLETRINIRKRFGISFGMGMRKNYPAISSKLVCRLF